MPVSEHEREVETRAKLLAGLALREQTERLVEANAEVARLRGIIDELTPERRCECGHLEDEHAPGWCGVLVTVFAESGRQSHRPCSCAGFRECS